MATEPRMSTEKVVPEVSINRVQYKSNSAEARATMIKCTNLLFYYFFSGLFDQFEIRFQIWRRNLCI